MQKKISIFIKKNFLKEKLKQFFLKNLSNGPKSLIENALSGLKENKISFKINPKIISDNDICWVINDPNKLIELINLKKKKN